MLATVAVSTFDEELEGLLDRQRIALRRLWVACFLLVLGLIVAGHVLVGLGSIGWGGLAFAALVAYVLLQGAVTDYRAAHEAVVRRVARR